MTEWKAQLESFDSLLKELKQNREQGGRLRFGRSMIVVSDIKVDYKKLREEVERQGIKDGSP